MVFSTDNLYKKENIINDAPINKNIIKVSENTCFIIEAIHGLMEENYLIEKELGLSNLKTYTSRRLEALTEGNIAQSILKNGINVNLRLGGKKEQEPSLFQKIKSNLTVENIVTFLVKAFIKLIKRLWAEFEIICMDLLSKDSQIRRLHSKLEILGKSFVYNKSYFEYTHITDSPSRTDLNEQLEDISNEFLGFIEVIKSSKSSIEIQNILNGLNQKASQNDINYDETRGELLGANNYISEEDFNEACFKYFRNGSSKSIDSITINPDDIRRRLDYWKRAPKIVRGISRDKDKLETAGEKLANKIKRAKVDEQLAEVPENTINLYNSLVSNFVSRVKTSCNIFIIFYGHKLEAAKQDMLQNKAILYEACKLIVREGV